MNLELNDFFRGIIDSEEGPIVICNLEYRIIYENPVAHYYYSKEAPIQGKLLESLMDEERMSRVRMCVEWFKEDRKNNKVFAVHDEKNNMDMYILAIRNTEGELIGFYGRREDRNPDLGEPFDFD